MLRVYNNAARYVDQGGNKRPGSIAVYLEPWHADILDFLDLKKNTGKEEQVKIHLVLGVPKSVSAFDSLVARPALHSLMREARASGRTAKIHSPILGYATLIG